MPNHNVEMAIEKNETTATQWLKKQTQNKIANDVKEKYKTRPPQTCGKKRNVTFLLTCLPVFDVTHIILSLAAFENP